MPIPGERVLYQKILKTILGVTDGVTDGVTKTEKKNGFKVRLLPKTGFKMAEKRYSRGDNTII